MKQHGIYLANEQYYKLLRELGATVDYQKQRPLLYALSSPEHDSLYFLVPITTLSTESKKRKIESFMNRKGISSSFYEIGNVAGREVAFKISSALPVTENYVREWMLKGQHYIVRDKKVLINIEKKLKHILSYENKNPNRLEQRLTAIQNTLLDELNRERNQNRLMDDLPREEKKPVSEKMKPHYTKEYIEDVLIRFAYHSTGIEGNTLTLSDTASILMYGKVTGKKNYTLREIYEIDNHKQAFDYMLESAQKDISYTPTLVREFHALLTEKIQSDSGQYKTMPNYILGAEFQPVEPFEVPMKIQEWCSNLNEKLEQTKTDRDYLKVLLESHQTFEKIHPFSDGNGRTGRLLLNYGLAKKELPLLVIERKYRADYIGFLATDNRDEFLDFSEQKLAEEMKRMLSFYQIERKKLID